MNRAVDSRVLLAAILCCGGPRTALADFVFADGFESPLVVINEVESNPSPDFVEFHNATADWIDVSGWTFTDADPVTPGHVYTFASGTIIPAGGFVVYYETTDFTFGLGATDEVHLYDTTGRQRDAFGWTAHAAGVFARCPDAGAFRDVPTPTAGSSNASACP